MRRQLAAGRRQARFERRRARVGAPASQAPACSRDRTLRRRLCPFQISGSILLPVPRSGSALGQQRVRRAPADGVACPVAWVGPGGLIPMASSLQDYGTHLRPHAGPFAPRPTAGPRPSAPQLPMQRHGRSQQRRYGPGPRRAGLFWKDRIAYWAGLVRTVTATEFPLSLCNPRDQYRNSLIPNC